MKLIAIIFMLNLLACSCISNKEKKADDQSTRDQADVSKVSPINNVEHMEVQPQWQESFLELIQKQAQPETEAWALFSYSGWADSGQIIVFTNKEQQPQAFFANPGSKEVNHEKAFSTEDFQSFVSSLEKFNSLKDFQMQAMDGTQWEFVHVFLNSQAQVEIKQKVFMNNPGLTEEGMQHSELVKTFLELWKNFGLR